MKKLDKQYEAFKDMVLEEAKKGNIVIMTVEGTMTAPIEGFIKQPTLGLLYDLNRDSATILTFIKDVKWVNDYACMLVISKLKEENEKLKKELLRYGCGNSKQLKEKSNGK